MSAYDMEKLVLTDGTDTYTLKPDTTLAKSGVPADAKKVGDELTDVKSDLSALGLSVVDGMICVTFTEE